MRSKSAMTMTSQALAPLNGKERLYFEETYELLAFAFQLSPLYSAKVKIDMRIANRRAEEAYYRKLVQKRSRPNL